MKSIVLCESNYRGQNKEDRTSDKTNKDGIKNEKTKKSSVKDDSLSSGEICQIVENAVNGEDKSAMKKNESNNDEAERKEEECSSDGNCADGETVETRNGATETFKDEEEIEILSCIIKIDERVSEDSESSKNDVLEKQNEPFIEGSDLLSNCEINSGDQNSHTKNSDTVDCSEPCFSDGEIVEEVSKEGELSRIHIKESERDCTMVEVNSRDERMLVDSDDVREREMSYENIEDEFDAEEVERGRQSSDEGFIEEEENKENRSDESGKVGSNDTKTRHKENIGTPIVECVESAWESEDSFKPKWNEEKTESHEFLESNEEEEECSMNNDIHLDEMETSDCEKNLDEIGKDTECDVSEGGEVVGSSEQKILNKKKSHKKDKCFIELNKDESLLVEKSEEEMMQKRKRFSVDEGGLIESYMKKRRMEENNGITSNEIKRRHSHDTTFRVTENITEESCHDAKDNEKDSEKEEIDNGASKKNALEESIDRVASGSSSLPFLESLRDTIKTLSRNDLEELIVQKLCEVITERSTVGDLRKKAQALEQDQERWKEKVHSLTKQLREMDMVMKRYMNEVQKQNKEKNFQMVAPLRVTRSVGLQVSFGSLNSKLNVVVPSNSQSSQPVIQSTEKVVKQPSQSSVNVSQNVKKNVPILSGSQNKKQVKEQKKQSFAPKLGVTFQARLISPQAVATTSNRTVQNQQINTVNRSRMPVPDQNSSKIIDLTDDDDKQNSETSPAAILQTGVSVRPPGQIRLVNQIQPAQVNAGGRVAYLVPAGSATATGSTLPQQSRQLLIATPAAPPPPRQLLPSVPPLLYKGSTILQPGVQQSPVINQQNRALLPKKLKHPAPLPQPPANQIQKPNLKLLPPRPALKISKVQTGIVLSWNMTLGPEYEPIACYQLYAYQENNSPPATSLWKKVGDVKALPLPMACTLTQFMSGHKYHFAVRAVDLHSRIGPFSFPGSIVLIK